MSTTNSVAFSTDEYAPELVQKLTEKFNRVFTIQKPNMGTEEIPFTTHNVSEILLVGNSDPELIKEMQFFVSSLSEIEKDV